MYKWLVLSCSRYQILEICRVVIEKSFNMRKRFQASLNRGKVSAFFKKIKWDISRSNLLIDLRSVSSEYPQIPQLMQACQMMKLR